MRKPNILWICTDQQRFDSLGCYGNDKIDTPNIDELAQRGILFENAYCQSPVCAPSRASFLTGRYPRTCRVRQNGQRMPENEKLVTKIFSDAGYTVGLAGKLHIAPCHTRVSPAGEPRGEDGYTVFHWSHHPDFDGKSSNWPTNEYNIWLREHDTKYERVPYHGSKYVYTGVRKEFSHSHFCAQKAIEFIKGHEYYPEQPWFFSLNFYDPHHDFDPAEDLLEKYIARLDDNDLPKYIEGELMDKPEIQKIDHNGAYSIPGHFAYDDMTANDHLEIKAAYYAMVDQIDREVGRVIQTLKETGQYEKTIIIFTSDHGEMLGDHGIYLKGAYFYAPMVKVPLIVSWEGHLQEGIRKKALVELIDIAPTLLDYADLSIPDGMQGGSLRSLLEDREMDEKNETVYCEFYNSMRHNSISAFSTMVADKRYKFCYCHSSNQGELYDMKTDPGEIHNYYNDPGYTDIKIQMMEKMLNCIAFTADPLPVREAEY